MSLGGKGQNERKVSTFVARNPGKPLDGIYSLYRPEAPGAVPRGWPWEAWLRESTTQPTELGDVRDVGWEEGPQRSRG
jgi:hypothetical protein